MFENQRLKVNNCLKITKYLNLNKFSINKDLGKIGLIMDKFIRINIFKDTDALNYWNGNLASALFVTIETMLGIDLSSKIDEENSIYKKQSKENDQKNEKK